MINTDYTQTKHTIGGFCKSIALVLLIVTLFVTLESIIQMKEAAAIKNAFKAYPLPQTKALILESGTLASQLKIAAIALGVSSFALGAIGLFLCRDKVNKEERAGRILRLVGTLLAAVTIAAALSMALYAQEGSWMQNCLGSFPLPGLPEVINNATKISHIFRIVAIASGSLAFVTLGASVVLLRKEKEEKAETIARLCKMAALLFAALAGFFLLQHYIHVAQARYLQDGFGSMHIEGMDGLIGRFGSLATTFTHGAILAGGLSVIMVALHKGLKADAK